MEQSYQLDNLLYRLRVRATSDLIAKSLAASRELRTALKLNVIAVQSQGGALQPAGPDRVLEQDDLLVVEGDAGRMLQAANTHGLEHNGMVSLEEFNQHEPETLRLAEVMVPFRSPLIGQSLAEIGFRHRYGLNVLAIGKPTNFRFTNGTVKTGKFSA